MDRILKTINVHTFLIIMNILFFGLVCHTDFVPYGDTNNPEMYCNVTVIYFFINPFTGLHTRYTIQLLW